MLQLVESDNPEGAGNQQERSVLSQDALAGLIVGEGSYCIAIARARGYISLRPMFSLRMNDVETIDLICSSFEHFGLDIYRNPAVYHRCHSVSVDGAARMRRHLDFFLPVLFGKKREAAQVLSEFTDWRLGRMGLSYTEEDVVFVERLREINGPSGPRLNIEILRDYTRRAATNPRRKRRAAKI